MFTTISPLQRNIWLAALVLAPTLLVISQFFWRNGMIMPVGGVLMSLAFVCWVPAFQALFFMLKDKMPAYAALGFVIAVWSCFAGNNFGIEGIYLHAMGVTDEPGMRAVQAGIGGLTPFYLFIPGILFPLSLLALGINLLRTKRVNTLTGLLLCLGAVGFPLSRIPRIEWLAHLDNVIMLAAHVLIALTLASATRTRMEEAPKVGMKPTGIGV